MPEYKEISVGDIILTGTNPRKNFDEKELKELGESMKEDGQLQEIWVRPRDNKYELVIGERRYRSAKFAGISKLKAKIEDVDDARLVELQLLENVQRLDLTEVEKGNAVAHLLRTFPDKYPTISSVAKKLHKEDVTVTTWMLKSDRLSENLTTSARRGRLSERILTNLIYFDRDIQEMLAKAIIEYGLTKTVDRVELHREFLRLYKENSVKYPTVESLEILANQVKGVKKVKIDLSKLSNGARNEVDKFLKQEEKKKKAKRKAEVPDEERCIGITAKGKRCGKHRLPDNDYCKIHDLEHKKIRKHKKTTPKPKFFTCATCDMQFQTKDELESHVDQEHPKPPTVPITTKSVTIGLTFPLSLWEKLVKYQAGKGILLGEAITQLLESHPDLED